MSSNNRTLLSRDAPISVSTIEYDFEEYALNYGIPETIDPLPYRKAGSVFATGEEAEPILTSAKHDPRLRTVVCRHWLRDLCMKGAACEFLHQYDLQKMPLCRHGEKCKIKDCPFRHISEENRMECAFYKSGFCIHGPFCRYKHVKRPREDLPLVADFTLGLSQMQAGNKDSGASSSKRPAPKPNEFYKISLCKHYASGDCPFGEGCHFAHGEAELRTFPRKQETTVPENDELGDHMFSNVDTTSIDYFQGGAVGGGKPCPINDSNNTEQAQPQFFIILAATQQDLAISTVRKEWYVQKKDGEKLNAAYYGDTISGSTKQVMIFFTVSGSKHIQGAAIMIQPATYSERADSIQKENKKCNNNNNNIPDETFCYRICIEWYRTTEYPIKNANEVVPDLMLPSLEQQQYCVNLSSPSGTALMKALWNSPVLTLYESWEDYYEDGVDSNNNDNNNNYNGPPAPENILTDFRAPGMRSTTTTPNENNNDTDNGTTAMITDEYDVNTNEASISWPTMPGPGFIFGCSSDTMDECLGRGIFGLPAHMKSAASHIAPGATIFLFNVTDRLLFGIFEAITPARMNIVPTAFSKNPKATSSPFPVQIRVRVSLECPPLEDTDPIFNDILRSRGHGRIGPLSHAQTVAVASLLATQCGALQYMIEYQKGLRQGASVRPPPIALPPRKIIPKEKDKEMKDESTT